MRYKKNNGRVIKSLQFYKNQPLKDNEFIKNYIA